MTATYAQEVTLRGASMFDEKHAFTKTMVKFAELVDKYYDGDVKFDLRLNGELGVEKDYVNFLQQGVAIDYTIMAPSNMAKFAPSIPLMDMPFLFRDLTIGTKCLSSDAFGHLEAELAKNADIMVIGYTGGGVRNLVSSKPIGNLDDLAGHKMRVMGAPIQAQIFSALTAAPSAIAYNEVYNAIQSGVIAGFENEAASIQNLKFYEVAPNVTLTRHTITVRPIVMSGKTFRNLPEALQAAIKKAGAEAGAFGRELESREDGIKLQEMVDARPSQSSRIRRDAKNCLRWLFPCKTPLLPTSTPPICLRQFVPCSQDQGCPFRVLPDFLHWGTIGGTVSANVRTTTMFGRALEFFCQGLRLILGCLMASLAIPVGMQVISRYTGVIPTYLWTEELATFIFVWVVMIGSMIAVWEGTHFDVVITPDASRPLTILLQKGIVLVLITVFALLFAWYGIEFAKVGAIQSSVMMRANLLWIYIAVPLAGFVWALFPSTVCIRRLPTLQKSRRAIG